MLVRPDGRIGVSGTDDSQRIRFIVCNRRCIDSRHKKPRQLNRVPPPPPQRYYHFGKMRSTPWTGPLDNEINRIASMRAAYTTRFYFFVIIIIYNIML